MPRLRVKIFDRELEVEGDEAIITDYFQNFRSELMAEFALRTARARQSKLRALQDEEFRLHRELKNIRKQLLEA